jgi:tRNA A-37 threonylcarbamoyl transferase component Bud32
MFPPVEPTATFPYRIVAKVGEGAMGMVYRAVEPALERQVAIKVLRVQADQSADLREEIRRRFLQEARAAAALSHPGITTIYRVGEEGGEPFIAMEWLDGTTLENLLESGPLPVARVARIAVELLDTLAAAHRVGVVHRDIKPANLVLLSDGRLKVTDFGIAHVAGSDLVRTQPGMILATPQYASPEQLQGADVDGRSDIFSAGVVLYQCLTGRLPFTGRNILELVSQIANTEPVPLREIAPGLHPALDMAISRSLRKDRNERYATAGEMAEIVRPLASSTGPVQPLEQEVATLRMTAVPAASHPRYPILSGLPADSAGLVAGIIATWQHRHLGPTSTAELLARLLERPLHAPPFSGLAVVQGTCLLVHAGTVVGAFELGGGRTGDEACEALPESAQPTLYRAPDEMPAGIVPLLASLFQPPRFRHANLDSSVVNVPGLVEKLEAEGYEGILRLDRNGVSAYIFLLGGRTALAAYPIGWEDTPIDLSWETWVGRYPMHASLLEPAASPTMLSYRRELRDCQLDVDLGETVSVRTGRTLCRLRRTTVIAEGSEIRLSPVAGVTTDLVLSDPTYRFLAWMLQDMPGYFIERGRLAKWKYLAEWLGLVRKAWLHNELPRPNSRDSDFFDLVTAEADGKVLHLAHRVARGSPAELSAFTERVKAAKTARIKRGDVGGAILVSPYFEPSALDLYERLTAAETAHQKFLGLEDKLTGYEGFVRIGPRRGFHLLLVREGREGFEPVLPKVVIGREGG